jgi:ATP-dependent RNA helicase DeaD
MNFIDFKLSPNILKALQKLNFNTPTLIQEKCIPLALEGKDIVAQSQTGSGKTAAFGLPIIEQINHGKGLQALILTPTRELCVQVMNAIKDYSEFSSLNISSVYGGVSYGPQIDALKKADIIVATPGRLIDHIERKNTYFSNVRFVILDEADKMIEMGFLEDVEKILKFIPKNRQMMLFSATFPDRVGDIVDEYLKNPVFIKTERFVNSDLLTQHYYKTNSERKFGLLVHLLKKEESNAIIFCSTRNEADYVNANLREQNIKSMPIHGGHSQNKRQNSIDKLHDGKIAVLVATDVASRGLDIRNVTHIYNYDIPPRIDDYTHRIGRTARAGESGKAISLVSNKDKENFEAIFRYQKRKIQEVKNPKFETIKISRDSFLLKKAEREERSPRRNNFKGKNKSGEKKFDRNKFSEKKPKKNFSKRKLAINE